MRRCRFCRFWRGKTNDYRACELGREMLIVSGPNDRCPWFQSGGLLPEAWVDVENLTPGEEALRLCEVGM